MITILSLIGGLGALAAAIATYLIALRRTAGTVKHSEAEQVWSQTQALIDDLMERNEFLRKQYDECSASIRELDRRVFYLEEENRALHLQNGELKKRVVELEDEVKRLTADNTRKDAEILVLRGRIKELEDQYERA